MRARLVAPSSRAGFRKWATPLVAVILTMLIAGCGAGSTGQDSPGQDQDVALTNLRHKVEVLQHDPCFTGDPHATYPNCLGRYIAEVDNVVLAAVHEASTKPRDPDTIKVAKALGAASSAFQTRHCRSTDDDADCARELSKVNANLGKLAEALPSPAKAPSESGAPGPGR